MESSGKTYLVESIGTAFVIVGTLIINGMTLPVIIQYELLIFFIWYAIAALAIAWIHPKPSGIRLLICAILFTCYFILITDYWIDPNIGILEYTGSLVDIYLHYLISLPIFFMAGKFSTKLFRSQ